MKKICTICQRQYIFNKRNKPGHTSTKCNSCYVNTRRFYVKQFIVFYLGGSCVICGYNQCFGALQAHHLNPKRKDFNLSGAHSRSEKDLIKELNKCILVCSNCHRKLHHNCNEYNCNRQ